jgi:hypothetical protein
VKEADLGLLNIYLLHLPDQKGETQSTFEAFVFRQKASGNGTTLFPTPGNF